MRWASHISRQVMGTTAAKTRVHGGRHKLPGPSSTAQVHRTGTDATYKCHTVTGACCFCVRGCSGHRPRTRPEWPRLRACDWLVLRARPAGDALAIITVINSSWWLWPERASCIQRLRSRVRPRPPCPHASRYTRAAGVPGANDPVARMQLCSVDVLTWLNRHLCSAYALRSTIESSDHGGRGT
jgi:hypothetical protein